MTIKNQQKQKVLVIGGSGYIGSEFCNFLLNKNLQVDCVDNGIYENNFSIRKLKKFKNFKFYNKDLRSNEMRFDDKKTNVTEIITIVICDKKIKNCPALRENTYFTKLTNYKLSTYKM